MSRSHLPLLGLILTALAYPLPTVAVQSNDGPIPIYSGHPQFAQKQNYASRAEWPLFSVQTHWCENSPLMPGCQLAPKVPAHGHIDCRWPLFGIIQRAPLTVDCTARMFHMPGETRSLVHYGWGDTLFNFLSGPLPYAGDPDGLVEKLFTVTFRAEDMPATNGLWKPNVTGVFPLLTGSGFYTYAEVTLYVQANPAIPVPAGLSGHDFVSTSHVAAGGSGTGVGSQGHPTVDFPGWLPIAPLAAPFDVVARGFSYLIEDGFPGSGLMDQWLHPNLHAHDPGTLLQRVDVPATQLGVHTALNLRLDPAVLGQGTHKILTRWAHTTGAGNARFAVGETFEALATFDVVVGDVVTPPPPPPPTDPIPCGGTWDWAFTDAGLTRLFTRRFTVSAASLPNCIRPTVPQ